AVQPSVSSSMIDHPAVEDQPVTAATDEVLDQFLGDETFPVAWDSDAEKEFFWVYDDLHIPNPVSPMFFDIGGWWLSCDHMFRRFGTPFAVDWLAKNVNGYVYTTAIPADPDLHIEATEYSSRYQARVPRDANFQATMGAYLDTVLPVYGRDFADWWRDRLRPEMERNFADLEQRLDAARGSRFIADRVEPSQRGFGWDAVWSHEVIYRTVREQMGPVLELVRGYLETDYDFPGAILAMRKDIESASREILEGLTGDAFEEMRAANEVNLRMAPLTPDHHFYIDQGANAHLRLVLLAVGRKLVESGHLNEPDDVIFLRYNELRQLIGS